MIKTYINLFALLVFLLGSNTIGQDLETKTGHIKFFSTTPVEDIESNNYKVISSLSKHDGTMVFSVPMQSFEFKKALMQKHFNQPSYLDTKKFPKAKFKGNVTNNTDVNYSKPGTYEVIVEGELTLHGVTNPIKAKGTLDIAATGLVKGATKFNLTLADYGIVFEKGKSSKSIAKTVEVTVNMDYRPGR